MWKRAALVWALGASCVHAAARLCNVRDYGARGDNRTKDTASLVTAVSACKGGTVLLPAPGTYLTGPINLTDGQTLVIEAGATLAASQDVADYPAVPAFPSYGTSRDISWKASMCRYGAVVGGVGVRDVTIRGGGTIDGQGWRFWRLHDERKLDCTRPRLIEFERSHNVSLRGLTLRNSAFWTVHVIYSDTFEAADLTILAPIDRGNTDGIDPDSTSNVLIRDSFISTGDDAVAIKSGLDAAGLRVGIPSQNVSVVNVTCAGHGGVSVGSETSGGIRDVTLRDVKMIGQVGMRIKTCKGRGSFISNVRVRDAVGGVHLYMKNPKDCNTSGPWPALSDFHFTNLQGECNIDCGEDPLCDNTTFTFNNACGL